MILIAHFLITFPPYPASMPFTFTQNHSCLSCSYLMLPHMHGNPYYHIKPPIKSISPFKSPYLPHGYVSIFYPNSYLLYSLVFSNLPLSIILVIPIPRNFSHFPALIFFSDSLPIADIYLTTSLHFYKPIKHTSHLFTPIHSSYPFTIVSFSTISVPISLPCKPTALKNDNRNASMSVDIFP